jgi:hypothetical protein
MTVHVRVVTIDVQTSEGDPRRSALLNRALRELEPDLCRVESHGPTTDNRTRS